MTFDLFRSPRQNTLDPVIQAYGYSMFYLRHLSLKNFRNYLRLELDLPRGITVIQGRNAQGKTNLLEAVTYLATSKSLRAFSDAEVVHWMALEREPIPFAEVAGEVQYDGNVNHLRIVLTQQGGRGSGLGFRKVVTINGARKRALDLMGLLPVVLFLPEDIDLIAGPPSGRRRYLNLLLCQMDREYCHHLDAYNKVVARRNAQLRALQGRPFDENLIAYWDEALIDHGTYLIHKRQDVIARLDMRTREQHRLLAGHEGRLRVEYRPSVDLSNGREGVPKAQLALRLPAQPVAYRPQPVHSIPDIRKRFAAHLAKLRAREVEAGMTLVGPHRDDMVFLLDGRDLRTYGSRGQQRTAALALKLAEVQVLEDALGASPLLLLDDVMSELDEERRGQVLHLVAAVPQAILTTTDWADFSPEFLTTAHCLEVEGGIIRPVKVQRQ